MEDFVVEGLDQGVKDELGENVSVLERFNNQPVSNLAKSYVHLNKKLSTSINIPGENASAEEVASFNRKIGKPDSSDAYEITMPDDLDSESSAKELVKIKQAFHGADLTKKQAKAVFDFFKTNTKEAGDSRAKASKAAEDVYVEDLTKTHGDKKESALIKVNNMLDKYVGEGTSADFEKLPPKIKTMLVKMLPKVADELGVEATPVLKTVANGSDEFNGDVSEINQKINSLRNDPAYYGKAAGDTKGIRAEVIRLTKIREDIKTKAKLAEAKTV